MEKMIIYGNSETCEACKELKIALDAKGVDYDYRDLAEKDNLIRIGYKKEMKALQADKIPFAVLMNGMFAVGFDDIMSKL